MWLFTQKDSDLFSYFDIFDEREFDMTNFLLKHKPINSDTNENNNCKRGANPFEHFFGFRNLFRKIEKCLGLELQLRTSKGKQNFIYTILGVNAVNVTFNKLFLYIPRFVPSSEQQRNLNESNKSGFTLSFDWGVSDRISVNTDNEYQLDIGSASIINVPSYLIAAHKKTQRDYPARPPNQFNIVIFENIDVKR